MASLSNEQQAAVRAAELNLDKEKRDCLERWRHLRGPAQPSMLTASDSDMNNNNPKACVAKGKTVHPGNWQCSLEAWWST